eukprot:c18538_g1_i7.p1 GENE.c18538_g1_i7~~c18538_g1_i7.p1  ORF type:complete len:152 (+),score=20.11 c18538_g1_i7:238-693(+)
MPCLCVLLRRKGKFTEYRNLDVIWKHPESGGKVFCGNLTAAQTKGILEEHGITHILNCQELKSRNYFEEDPNFTYGRMPVATWSVSLLPNFLEADINSLERVSPDLVLQGGLFSAAQNGHHWKLAPAAFGIRPKCSRGRPQCSDSLLGGGA